MEEGTLAELKMTATIDVLDDDSEGKIGIHLFRKDFK